MLFRSTLYMSGCYNIFFWLTAGKIIEEVPAETILQEESSDNPCFHLCFCF